MDTSNYKTVRYSKTTLTELMIPSYANFGGKVHGGIILGLMDKLAYVCAAKHAGNYCVTASINNVDFLAPVNVGDLVALRASVNYVGNASLVIGIRIVAENVKTRISVHTNTSYFTMVAMDDTHKPAQVPGLILESKDEVRRFAEAMQRQALKKEHRQAFQKLKKPSESIDYTALLKNERCLISETVTQ